MNTCHNCQSELMDNAVFCHICGARQHMGASIAGKEVTVTGDVVAGDKVISMPEPGPGAEALHEAYLRRVVASAGRLSLAGIDPKVAAEAEAQLQLGAVYTALLTYTPELRDERDKRGDPGFVTRPTSALWHLDRFSHFVLLGDPGSGKSTFVNFVALCMAGEALGMSDINLELLRMPLPTKEPDDEPKPQPWQHGALVPVRVILRDLAARGLPSIGEYASAEHLWNFVVSELERAGLHDYAPHLRTVLMEQGGLILLDGLDEVPAADQRRTQIKQMVEDFAASYSRCRILVTSRTYAYQRQDWRLGNFNDAVLAPFTAAQVSLFVERWYAHIAEIRGMNAEDASGRAELLKRAIDGSDRLQGLAERPLLLTLMASLHAWRGGSLPEKREELYADTVDLLLDWWEQPKLQRDAHGEVLVQPPSLAEWLKVDRARVRSLLNEIAFEAHAGQADLEGTADVPQGRLADGLLQLSNNPDVSTQRLIEYLSDRAGLLLPRGVGVYTFPHRTFQEYLAACHLTDLDYPDALADFARADPNRWREAALLAGAKAARGASTAVWNLAEALCPRDVELPDGGEADLWGAHLAGQLLVESGNLAGVSERNQPKAARVRDWLVHILQQGKLPAVERAQAGDALAELGDTRFHADRWYLPDDPRLGFLEVSAGPFLMGTNPEKDGTGWDDEQPQRRVDLPRYFIGKFPVTVAQFRAFVEDSGFEPRDRNSLHGIANHPVVYVMWHDALAYSDWLNQRMMDLASERVGGDDEFWQAIAGGELSITLPSEAQWEKAARGVDGRIFPWGDEADPERANYGDTGIGRTSAVGCFPGGASPYDALDMSGNVWEWCATKWQEEYKDYRDDNEVQGNAPRVVRGGAFFNEDGHVRCAFRAWSDPDLWYGDQGFRVAASPTR